MEEAIFDDVQGTFVGIDLGTSNSVVSFFNNGKVEQVKFKGKKTIPSVLYFESKDKVIVGVNALKKGMLNPLKMLKEFKRDLGTKTKYTLSFSEVTEVDEPSVWIIDTNIFIEEPRILSAFSKSEKIIIPNKVLDELSFRAKDPSNKDAADLALAEIQKFKSDLRLEFKADNLSLLSEGYEQDKNSQNDNRILSVAKESTQNANGEDVYLLTNDNALQVKAQTENIDNINLKQFQIIKSNNEQQQTIVDLKVSPKDATRHLLRHIRQESNKIIGEDVQKAVITVPATFDQTQIGQVKEAGEEAGFDEIKIQKEPVAVGFAYAMEEDKDKTILVYDFGGGTFDATLLNISNGVITIEATDGDDKLGGKDVTTKVIELIYDKIEDQCGLNMFDLSDSELSKGSYKSNEHAIWIAAEKAKIELSDCETTNIDIANLVSKDGSEESATNFNLKMELSKKEFEDEIAEIKKQSLDIIKNMISTKNIDIKSIDSIVMAGGTSSIPSIRDSIEDTFGIAPQKTIDTSIVISQGAVFEAIRHWSESDTIQEKIIYNDNSLNDFGVGIKGLTFDELIPSGSNLPISEHREYTTEHDNQETISIKIFQRKTTYPNAKKTHDKGVEFIDEIKIDGIPQCKVGEISIDVIFELTKDDTLEVSVKLLDKNKIEIHSDTKAISKVSNG